jgi:hypothetical protein
MKYSIESQRIQRVVVEIEAGSLDEAVAKIDSLDFVEPPDDQWQTLKGREYLAPVNECGEYDENGSWEPVN